MTKIATIIRGIKTNKNRFRKKLNYRMIKHNWNLAQNKKPPQKIVRVLNQLNLN